MAEKQHIERRGGPRPKIRLDDERGSPLGVPQQPAYEPTDEDRQFVRDHAAIMGRKMMARRLGINPTTLKKYYDREIVESCFKFAATIGGMVAKRALSGDHGAQYFVLRRFGWTDREEFGDFEENTVKDEPLAVPPEVLEALSDEDFAAYERICDLVARSTPGLASDRPPVALDSEAES